MAKISTYSVVNPEGDDKIIISESSGNPSNVTKNVTVDGLKTFIVNGLPVPTLQEVTTSGNTTTKNITTQGIKSEGTRDIDLVVKVGDYDGSGAKTKLEVDVENKIVSVDSDILRLTKLGGTRTDITFNPTATRLIAMPDASGTIALTSDLPSASPWNPDTNGINYQAGNVGIGVGGLQFQELWDASSDIPNLSTATPNNGDFWIVKVAGTTNLSGITNWFVGDWAIYIVPSGGGTAFWQKVDNTTSISGTGTGNQVAKWSGVGASTTLTDSIITSTEQEYR